MRRSAAPARVARKQKRLGPLERAARPGARMPEAPAASRPPSCPPAGSRELSFFFPNRPHPPPPHHLLHGAPTPFSFKKAGKPTDLGGSAPEQAALLFTVWMLAVLTVVAFLVALIRTLAAILIGPADGRPTPPAALPPPRRECALSSGSSSSAARVELEERVPGSRRAWPV